MIKVVYWSLTGYTKDLAQTLAEEIRSAGLEAETVEMDAVHPADLAAEASFALGAPAMGMEELEDGTVEPFVAELESLVNGKEIALFGSFAWGNGQWMREWTERMKRAGAQIVGGAGLAVRQDTPEKERRTAMRQLGLKLAEASLPNDTNDADL